MSMDAAPRGMWAGLRLRRRWPWLVLALMVIPAVWHVLDFDEDIDPEFPTVERPTFSVVPPAAYRLAEPGDTLDRVEIYLAAASVMLAAGGVIVSRGRGFWPASLAIGLAGFWYSATPGPTVDGWHGLGWRTIADPHASFLLRAILLAAALTLAGVVAATAWRSSDRFGALWRGARSRGTASLWIAAVVLAAARQFEIPGVEPRGYWPRCAMVWSLTAFDLCLLIELAPRLKSRKGRLAMGIAAPAGWLALVVLGIDVTWYHRPLARLREVVPDRIYISAMPTRRGLEVAQSRRHFRTIINLFPEETAQRSPLLGDELQFVREHGIRYVASPSDDSPAASNAFLNQTLALAQDPSAWPILVHCHGCMDRSPAWMGIYRFLVQGRPLDEIMQEIERHRGYRPKASVILLYNRVLPPRAGARYWTDPTAMFLRRCAAGTVDSRQGPDGPMMDPPMNLGGAASARRTSNSTGETVNRLTR
jgi:protein tyrosine phosphatase (PTP) superfamily phosphohydrolase (DUF442 family)